MSDPLAGLSVAQQKAVTHPAGPLLVLAAPGAGKTKVLAHRFAWLAAEAGSADHVLCLTRTPACARRMRERVEEILEPPYGDLAVADLPSFCEDLLRDEAPEAGLDPFFPTVTAADRLALLLDRIDDLTLRRHEIRGNPAPLLASFVGRVDRLKQQMVTAADYRAFAEGLVASARGDADRARAQRELEFAGLYEDHDRLLHASGALDWGDLVCHAFALLRDKPHVRERLARRHRHVLVDELEELDFAAAAVLRLLAGEHGSLTAAAAPDQAIHRFRAAAGKNVADLRREQPGLTVVRLERSQRCGRRILDAARAVLPERRSQIDWRPRAGAAGDVRFWRCRSDRAQAQAAAAQVERLLTVAGVPAGQLCVLVRSVEGDGNAVASALEERAIPYRLAGAGAYFKRAEVRDALAWLRLLADPGDSGAVVRALSRPPIGLRSVDLARLTQLARRRKLDMVSAVASACEGPQLSPEGRERAQAFLKLYRGAATALDEMRPDAFVHRLIERIGLRRRQVFAAQADTVERLRAIGRLADLASAYMRREPDGSSRGFARYLTAVAEAGSREDGDDVEDASADPRAVVVMTMAAAKELQFDHVLVLGLSAAAVPGPFRRRGDEVPDALLKESLPPDGPEAHEAAARRLLAMAMTRARKGLVLSFAESAERGAPGRPSPLYEEARAALDAPEELFEEELFGPAEGLHSTFRMMRDEVLDTVSALGGRLGEMRLDTYLDVSQAVARYLELLKLSALIERSKEGQPVAEALAEVNDLLLQTATADQREAFLASALDDYLLDAERDKRRRSELIGGQREAALDRFIPRRGDGLMLSASDIETYRLCPLKYKFARVFRIPQEPTINQRFGIVVHQVLERFHASGGGSLEYLMDLFQSSWRRAGFGDSNDDLQFRERAVAALARYWELDCERDADPVWFERPFSFNLGPHVLRGRVDRVDRLPGGGYELIDYKTGRSKSETELRQDIQLSIYQMGARESWRLETAAQSYYYVLDNEKVPVEHSAEELERVRETVDEIADGILAQDFHPTPRPDICAFCDYRIICPAAEV